MSTHIVLADYADSTRSFRAGEDVDASQVPLAELVRGGLAVIATSSTARVARDAYRIQALSNANASLVAMMAAAGVFGGGGSGGGLGVGEFIHADFGTQDEAQGRYVGTQGWIDLMAKLATIQFGAAPVVRLAYQGTPFVVPVAGMPATGWDFRGGSVASFFGATGAVVLDCPAGVKLDNLFSFGGETLGQETVVIKIAPPPGTGVLEFTALPPDAPWIHVIGGGSFVDHSTDTGAYMRGDDTDRSCVMVTAGAMQNSALSPPLSGPLVELGATDDAVSVQWGNGGLPTGWLAGGGPGSDLLNFYDDGAHPDTDNLAVWCPQFTGGGNITPLSWTLAKWAAYDDAVISPPLGATNAQGAIDVLKVALAARAPSEQNTYAPIVTPITPALLAAVAVGTFSWTRIGDLVRVTGILTVTPPLLSGDNQIDIDLPVATASAVGLVGQCSGSTLPNGNTDVMTATGPIRAAGGLARLYFSLAFANAPTAFTMSVDFSYVVS